MLTTYSAGFGAFVRGLEERRIRRQEILLQALEQAVQVDYALLWSQIVL